MRAVAFLLLGGCDLVFTLEGPPPVDAPVDGPIDPVGCSPASMLVDDFSGSATFPRRPWSIASANGTVASATETGGALRMTVQNGSFEVAGEPFLDMRGQRVSIEIALTGGGLVAGDQMTLDLLSRDGAHRILYGGMASSGGDFDLVAGYFEINIANQTSNFINLGNIPYDLGQHRHLAIEQIGDETRFLASSDGASFAPIFTTSAPPLDWIDFMRPSISTSAVNSLQFDLFSYNGGGQPIGDACPAGFLQESFQDGLSVEWLKFAQNCAIEFDAGGDMRFSFGGDTGETTCAIQNASYRDLREQAITLELKQFEPAAGSDAELVFQVETRTSLGLFGLAENASGVIEIFAGFEIDGATGMLRRVADFDPVSHAFWRFRGADDDTLIWEVSSDGIAFQPFASTVQPGELGALDAVRFTISLTGAGANNTVASLGGINAR